MAIKELDCIVGRSGGEWVVLAGGGHSSRNENGVKTSGSYYFTLDFGYTVTNILSFVVTADDAFAKAGVLPGATVGYSDATVYWGQSAQSVHSEVSYNGSAWSAANYYGSPSFVSFTNGVLRINHDECTDKSLSVVAKSGAYDVKYETIAGGKTEFTFWDAGTQVTTADTNMHFVFERKTHGGGVTGVHSNILNDIGGVFFISAVFEV